MGWEKWDQTVGQTAFAAHPRDDGGCHGVQDLFCFEVQVLGSLRFVHRAGALAGLAGSSASSVAGLDVDASGFGRSFYCVSEISLA